MVGRKRKDSRGETLVEMLASILIAALSVALLFTCCMTAAAMGRDTREADGRYYEALSAAEEKAGKEGESSVTVKGNGTEDTIDVFLYGGEEMYSYQKGAASGGT